MDVSTSFLDARPIILGRARLRGFLAADEEDDDEEDEDDDEEEPEEDDEAAGDFAFARPRFLRIGPSLCACVEATPREATTVSLLAMWSFSGVLSSASRRAGGKPARTATWATRGSGKEGEMQGEGRLCGSSNQVFLHIIDERERTGELGCGDCGSRRHETAQVTHSPFSWDAESGSAGRVTAAYAELERGHVECPRKRAARVSGYE